AGLIKMKCDLTLAGLFQPYDVTIVRLVAGIVPRKGFKRKNDIVGCDRLSVVPLRLGTQSVGGRWEIVRIGHNFSKQPVFGGRLVERGPHQGVGGERDTGDERAFDPGYDHIEIVKRADRDLSRATAFWRLGINVLEMRKPGRIFQLPEEGEAV